MIVFYFWWGGRECSPVAAQTNLSQIWIAAPAYRLSDRSTSIQFNKFKSFGSGFDRRLLMRTFWSRLPQVLLNFSDPSRLWHPNFIFEVFYIHNTYALYRGPRLQFCMEWGPSLFAFLEDMVITLIPRLHDHRRFLNNLHFTIFSHSVSSYCPRTFVVCATF